MHAHIWNFVLELASVCGVLIFSAAIIYGTAVIVYWLMTASQKLMREID